MYTLQRIRFALIGPELQPDLPALPPHNSALRCDELDELMRCTEAMLTRDGRLCLPRGIYTS